MVIEQLIFTIISFAIFVYMFFRMIKSNDTSYVIILVLEAIGIALNFVEVLFGIELNIVFVFIKYIFGILLPVIAVVLEINYMPISEIINISKAKFFFVLGNTKNAKKYLLKVLERNNNSYKAHLLLAKVYEQEGGMRKAIDEYVQAIDLNKQDYNSYYKVSELLNMLDRKDEASEMLFNLLNKKPDMLEASRLLGEILIEKEMYKEAANVYQEAIKYNPVDFELHYNLGIVYTMLNDFQSAKIAYEKAAELNSLSYNSKYSLAEIAMIYKELEEAEKRLLEVIDDEELSSDAYYELAKISLIKKDKETAIKYINIALDINSKKIAEKLKQDAVFIPILSKISIPFNLEEKESKLNKKERKAKEHLEEMCEITRHLSYSDIKLLKKSERKNDGKIQINEEEKDLKIEDKNKYIE